MAGKPADRSELARALTGNRSLALQLSNLLRIPRCRLQRLLAYRATCLATPAAAGCQRRFLWLLGLSLPRTARLRVTRCLRFREVDGPLRQAQEGALDWRGRARALATGVFQVRAFRKLHASRRPIAVRSDADRSP